jgi:hypothetical protein
MTPQEAAAAVIDAMNALQVPYMLVDSLSCNYYMVPRSTQDTDFVVQMAPGMISSLANRLGDAFRLDPQMSFETVTATTRYVLRLIDSAFVVELFLLSDDAHDQQRFARRRIGRILDRDVAIPTAEDVIVAKLRWSHAGQRTKDLEDARNVIAMESNRLDWDYVNSWCDRHGTRELLDQVRQSLQTK